MNFLNGLTLLLIFQLIGEAIALALRLPIPGPIIGMLLLFFSLFFYKNKTQFLNTTATTLLSHLSLLFYLG